jgi:hypothetical protein
MTILGISAIVNVLSGCTVYKPYEGTDAALLRTAQTGYPTVRVSLAPIDANGVCGKSIMLPALTAVARQSTASGPALTTTKNEAPAALRLDMLQAPNADIFSVSEQRVGPGVYRLSMSGSLQRPDRVIESCGLNVAITFRTGEQYWTTLSRGVGNCTLQVQRVQLEGGVQVWARHTEPVIKMDAAQCK